LGANVNKVDALEYCKYAAIIIYMLLERWFGKTKKTPAGSVLEFLELSGKKVVKKSKTPAPKSEPPAPVAKQG